MNVNAMSVAKHAYVQMLYVTTSCSRCCSSAAVPRNAKTKDATSVTTKRNDKMSSVVFMIVSPFKLLYIVIDYGHTEVCLRYSAFVKEEPMRMHRLRRFVKVLLDVPT